MLGGSAFNAIHAIAKTKAGLRLGYVGVAGRAPVISRTPSALLSLLRAFKRSGRGSLVSFGPGHVWISNFTPEVEGIIELADYLLLNNREFGGLGRRVRFPTKEAS
jgi:sugar/nucleoside kinase (ribokinase family)